MQENFVTKYLKELYSSDKISYYREDCDIMNKLPNADIKDIFREWNLLSSDETAKACSKEEGIAYMRFLCYFYSVLLFNGVVSIEKDREYFDVFWDAVFDCKNAEREQKKTRTQFRLKDKQFEEVYAKIYFLRNILHSIKLNTEKEDDYLKILAVKYFVDSNSKNYYYLNDEYIRSLHSLTNENNDIVADRHNQLCIKYRKGVQVEGHIFLKLNSKHKLGVSPLLGRIQTRQGIIEIFPLLNTDYSDVSDNAKNLGMSFDYDFDDISWNIEKLLRLESSRMLQYFEYCNEFYLNTVSSINEVTEESILSVFNDFVSENSLFSSTKWMIKANDLYNEIKPNLRRIMNLQIRTGLTLIDLNEDRQYGLFGDKLVVLDYGSNMCILPTELDFMEIYLEDLKVKFE